jgi:hypothetical protein
MCGIHLRWGPSDPLAGSGPRVSQASLGGCLVVMRLVTDTVLGHTPFHVSEADSCLED